MTSARFPGSGPALSACLMGLLVAAGCSSSKKATKIIVDSGPAGPSANDDWTMYGYDEGSTYFNKAETLISTTTAPKLDKAWVYDTGVGVTATPVISGGRVYVDANGGGVIALDLATGTEIWSTQSFYDASSPAPSGSSSLALDNGVLYLHDLGGTVRALDASDGHQLWAYKTDTDPSLVGFSSPIVTSKYVIIGGSTLEELGTGPYKFRGFVEALNKDGTLAWKKYTVDGGAHGATLWSSVAVDESLGMVIAGTGNNHGPPATDTSDAFLAMPLDGDPADGGTLLWKQQIFAGDTWALASLASPDDDFGANPVMFDYASEGGIRKLVAGGNKGADFWVLDRTQGTVIQKRHLDGTGSASQGGVFVAVAWDGKRLLTACNGASITAGGESLTSTVLYALDPLTLDIVWQRQVVGPVYSPISVANGVGFFGQDTTLQAFDTATGAVLKEYPTDGTIATAPAVSNGYVVFGSGMSWNKATAGTKYYALKVP